MPDGKLGDVVQVGEWLVSPALDSISRGTETHKLEPRTMRLLMCLANSAGAVVSVDRLLAEVWTGVIVGSASVYQAVSQLRKLLGDTDPNPTYIATVPRKGYRLIAPVLRGAPASASSPVVGAPAVRAPAVAPPLVGTAAIGTPPAARGLPWAALVLSAVALMALIAAGEWIWTRWSTPSRSAGSTASIVGTALPRSDRGENRPVVLRWAHGGAFQLALADPDFARRRAHLRVRFPRPGHRCANDRQRARYESRSRGILAPLRRSHASHGAAHRCAQRLSPVVRELRPAHGRCDQNPGGHFALGRPESAGTAHAGIRATVCRAAHGGFPGLSALSARAPLGAIGDARIDRSSHRSVSASADGGPEVRARLHSTRLCAPEPRISARLPRCRRGRANGTSDRIGLAHR